MFQISDQTKTFFDASKSFDRWMSLKALIEVNLSKNGSEFSSQHAAGGFSSAIAYY